MNDLLYVISDLMDCTRWKQTVSFHAVSVMAQMLIDGPVVWTLLNPTRQQVCDAIKDNIEKWKVDLHMKIKYRYCIQITLSPLQTSLVPSKTMIGRVHCSYLVLKGLRTI